MNITRGYQARPRNQVIRVVLEAGARYVSNVFRVSKQGKSGKRVYFSYNGLTYLGSFFVLMRIF